MACSYVGGGRSEYPSKGIGGPDGATHPASSIPKLKAKKDKYNHNNVSVHKDNI